jgi:CheY-like chemotaxis protein
LKSKILIVDDSRVSRMMIRGLFTTLCPEWDIIEAATGDEAVALASSARPDFITMDINMPGMNGFDAVRLIQQSNPTIRIAVLTANVQESSRDKAQKLAVKFVQKPATPAAIQQAVDYFCAPL